MLSKQKTKSPVDSASDMEKLERSALYIFVLHQLLFSIVSCSVFVVCLCIDFVGYILNIHYCYTHMGLNQLPMKIGTAG